MPASLIPRPGTPVGARGVSPADREIQGMGKTRKADRRSPSPGRQARDDRRRVVTFCGPLVSMPVTDLLWRPAGGRPIGRPQPSSETSARPGWTAQMTSWLKPSERGMLLLPLQIRSVCRMQTLALLERALADNWQADTIYTAERNLYLTQIHGLQQQLASAQTMLATAARFTCTPTPSPSPNQHSAFSTMF